MQEKLKTSTTPDAGYKMQRRDTEICGLCHYEFNHGARVCQGCQGTIVYGATTAETNESAKVFAVLFGGGALLLVYGLPYFLQQKMGWDVVAGWGLGMGGLAISGVAAAFGAYTGMRSKIAEMAGVVRTFR
ncbi:hypothetical protein [Chromobacterium violaceum]|uniref:hypothetical protein n=1 Tax=Chromobacterium violaceum TaxID=536 RepID=UPI001054719C|nr:hypothetical protein [Chromobacterium violaceum]